MSRIRRVLSIEGEWGGLCGGEVLTAWLVLGCGHFCTHAAGFESRESQCCYCKYPYDNSGCPECQYRRAREGK